MRPHGRRRGSQVERGAGRLVALQPGRVRPLVVQGPHARGDGARPPGRRSAGAAPESHPAAGHDVGVDEGDVRRPHQAQPGVARRGRPPVDGVRQTSSAPAAGGHRGERSRVPGPVVDDHDPGTGRQRREQPGELDRSVQHGHHDRDLVRDPGVAPGEVVLGVGLRPDRIGEAPVQQQPSERWRSPGRRPTPGPRRGDGGRGAGAGRPSRSSHPAGCRRRPRCLRTVARRSPGATCSRERSRHEPPVGRQHRAVHRGPGERGEVDDVGDLLGSQRATDARVLHEPAAVR